MVQRGEREGGREGGTEGGEGGRMVRRGEREGGREGGRETCINYKDVKLKVKRTSTGNSNPCELVT